MPGTDPPSARLVFRDLGSQNALTANRLVLLAAVPLFLVLAVVAYITVQFGANERDAQAWVRHTYQVMEAERRLQDDVQTAETGARGYLISHNHSAFLTAYRSFVARTPGDLKALRDLTADNPSQQRRADRLQKLIEQRVRGLDIATRLAPALVAAPTPVVNQALDRARQEMGQLRNEVTTGLAEEQRLLAQRDATRTQQEELEIAFATGAGLLVMGILLIAAAMLVRNNISLTATERARANEAAILQATLDTVRDGIAYFTSDGLLCAFNTGFFRLLDLQEGRFRIRHTTLAQLQAEGRPATIFSPPGSSQDPATAQHVVWSRTGIGYL